MKKKENSERVIYEVDICECLCYTKACNNTESTYGEVNLHEKPLLQLYSVYHTKYIINI